MDILATLLEGPRADGAFLLRSVMEPPWAMRIQDRASLTLIALTSGAATIVHEELDAAVEIRPGDIAVIKGPLPYTMGDCIGTTPQILINPGNDCVTLSGEPLVETMGLGVRTWGNSADGSTVFLTGTYERSGEASRQLLDAIPTVIISKGGLRRSPLVEIFADEIVLDAPGQGAMLDRLLDLVLVDTLRNWFAANAPQTPLWYQALSDPTIGAALRMIHDDPGQDWSVASLATAVNVSRATFARRFVEQVGEPPMTYIKSWRLGLAADLLADPNSTVSSVARAVGYHSPFTFSTAFKRHYGASPSAYRGTDSSQLAFEVAEDRG